MNDTPLKLDKALSTTFDVEPSMTYDIQQSNQRSIPEDSSLESDADEVRSVLYNLLKEGEDAFNDLKRIAVAEESPRSFEVLNSMLSNLSDIAVKLLDVHEKKEKLKKIQTNTHESSPVNNGTVNNNTVFVGTTADLQDIIKKITLN